MSTDKNYKYIVKTGDGDTHYAQTMTGDWTDSEQIVVLRGTYKDGASWKVSLRGSDIKSVKEDGDETAE